VHFPSHPTTVGGLAPRPTWLSANRLGSKRAFSVFLKFVATKPLLLMALVFFRLGAGRALYIIFISITKILQYSMREITRPRKSFRGAGLCANLRRRISILKLSPININ